MWKETKHGLFKQFNFTDFKEAFAFMTKVAAIAEEQQHHPRWENEWNVVQIWLATHEQKSEITDKDRRLAGAIDKLALRTDELKLPTSPSKKESKLKIFADGGSRGNPGPSATGYVITDMNDKILVNAGLYLGITTNNQAEYHALKQALEAAKKLQAQEVEVYMDSLLVINQMKGIFKVKNRDLWPVHEAIKQLVKSFKKVTFTQVPREMNKLADAAVNRTLDEQAKT